MEQNFTSLDIEAFQKKIEFKQVSRKSFDINTVFLALIVITLLILSVLLFILIQKKIQELAYLPIFS